VRATVNLFAHAPAVITSFEVMVNAPAQLSVATTEAIFATGTSPAQATVTSAGMEVKTGT